MSLGRSLCLLLTAAAAVGAQSCGSAEPAHPGPAGGRSTSTTPAARPAVAWTRAVAMHSLDRRRISVAGRSVTLDAGTLTCVGVGAATTSVEGQPAWTRFRCVQPTFPPGAVVGPDLIFSVEPTGPDSFLVRASRLTKY